jgi:hypothetical protein
MKVNGKDYPIYDMYLKKNREIWDVPFLKFTFKIYQKTLPNEMGNHQKSQGNSSHSYTFKRCASRFNMFKMKASERWWIFPQMSNIFN